MKYLMPLLFAILFAVNGWTQKPIILQLNFDTDQDTLLEKEKSKFDATIAKLQQPLPAYKAFLVGHTDNRGSLAYNQDLSRRRAETIQQLLIDLGLPTKQTTLDYQAYLNPIDKNEDKAARARNRRVDVILEPWLNNVSNDFKLIDNQSVTTFNYSRSKTTIQIPANAFVDADGSPVEGEVLVRYREFRDYADFMMSDLPMNFNWEGEKAYFNSTGMFEIQASDMQGRALRLAANKTIGIDFEQSQVLEGTQFWNFDESSGAWKSGNAYIDVQEGEMTKVLADTRKEKLGEFPLFFPEQNDWNSNFDTTTRLQTAHRLLPQILESVKDYDYKYVPQLDYNDFRARTMRTKTRYEYAGTDYIGHLPFEVAYANPSYYNIKLEVQGDSNNGKVQVKLVDVANKNPELEHLADIVWEVNVNNFKRKNQLDLRTERFADVRVYRKEKNYLLQLKHKNRLYEVKTKAMTMDEEDLSLSYRHYARAYRSRKEVFDASIEQLKENTLLLIPALQVLMPNRIAADEEELAAARTFVEGNIEKFLREGGRYFKPELTRDYLTKQEWRSSLADYDFAYEAEVPIYTDFLIRFNDGKPSLQLRGLGIFNLDVLKRFKEEKKLLARYETEIGEAIVIRKVEIINHRLNGLLRFENPQIYLDLESPTTIVAHAANGMVYYMAPDDLARLDLRNKDSFTFKLKPLGDFIAQPDLVRNLIAGI